MASERTCRGVALFSVALVVLVFAAAPAGATGGGGDPDGSTLDGALTGGSSASGPGVDGSDGSSGTGDAPVDDGREASSGGADSAGDGSTGGSETGGNASDDADAGSTAPATADRSSGDGRSSGDETGETDDGRDRRAERAATGALALEAPADLSWAPTGLGGASPSTGVEGVVHDTSNATPDGGDSIERLRETTGTVATSVEDAADADGLVTDPTAVLTGSVASPGVDDAAAVPVRSGTRRVIPDGRSGPVDVRAGRGSGAPTGSIPVAPRSGAGVALGMGVGALAAAAVARAGAGGGFAAAGVALSAFAGGTARIGGALRRVVRLFYPLRYSRYDDSDPLAHDARADVYEVVESSPGTHLSAVAERASLPLSTVRHHVRVLEREGLVSAAKVRGRRRLYPARTENVELAAALADEATAAVLDALARLGAASVSDLAAELDRDPSTVSHHLTRLAEDGVVVRERRGRAVESRLAPDARAALVPEEAPATTSGEPAVTGAD